MNLRQPRLDSPWPCSVRQPLAALVAALTLGLALPHATAGEQNRVRDGVNRGEYKRLSTIVAELTQRHPGRVVDVDTKRGPQGELRYEITLINPQGRRQELLVDAATGQVLAQEADLSRQALPMVKLASQLQRVEQQLGRRVVDAEFEVSHGKAQYKLKLAKPNSTAQKVLMDAATGALLTPAHDTAHTALLSIPELLRTLAPQVGEQPVLEVELELDARQGAYYEIELAQDGGGLVELHVDAKTGAILRRRVED